MSDAVVVAELVRNQVIEGHHRGSAVALGADGAVSWFRGNHRAPIFPRSCNKPLQALGMVEQGLDLPPELLALACASHSGEEFHVDGVRRILAGVGLDESALHNVTDYPLEDRVKEQVIRAGGLPSRVLMNCSGKHAAMLATCVVNGWDLETYLDREHPLQRAIASTFERATGEEVVHAAVDGCGAPLLSVSLTGLAVAFGRLAVAESGAERQIADAIRSHPEMVSGTTRDELALLRAMPGAIAKAGAEACYVVALPDGRAFALKIDDGGPRARPVVMTAMLVRAGVDREDWVDGEALRATGYSPLLGGGEVVGEIRAVL